MPGVVFRLPNESRCHWEFPGKSGAKVEDELVESFFFKMVRSNILFVFTPIWEK